MTNGDYRLPGPDNWEIRDGDDRVKITEGVIDFVRLRGGTRGFSE